MEHARAEVVLDIVWIGVVGATEVISYLELVPQRQRGHDPLPAGDRVIRG